MAYQRDPTGHWLAGLSDPTLSMRGFLERRDHLQRRQARQMGMNSTDMQALRFLDVHGPMGPSELAQHLDLRSASVTGLLDRLETAGMIERNRHGHDRRRVTVRVLPDAADMLFDTWAPVVRALDEVGRGLTPAEQQTVCTFFDRLAAVIDATTDAG